MRPDELVGPPGIGIGSHAPFRYREPEPRWNRECGAKPMAQVDRDQFADLFQEAYPRLWTVAAAIVGDRHRAQDVVQEAAMTGLRRLDSYETGTNFAAWMGQIVRFTALNARKTAGRRKDQAVDGHVLEQTVPDTPGVDSQAVSPSGTLLGDQLDFDDHLTKAVESLEPERRACLLLRIVHNLSYAEIAVQLGVPEGTAMSHVHRGKAALRRSLAADSSGGPSHE